MEFGWGCAIPQMLKFFGWKYRWTHQQGKAVYGRILFLRGHIRQIIWILVPPKLYYMGHQLKVCEVRLSCWNSQDSIDVVKK